MSTGLGEYSGSLICIVAGALSFLFSRRTLDSSGATSLRDRTTIDVANFNRRLGRYVGLALVAVGSVILVVLLVNG